MKKFIKVLIAFLNQQLLLLFVKRNDKLKGVFYKVRCKISKESNLNIAKANLEKVIISLSGIHNKLNVDGAYISETTITVTGTGNVINIGPGVKLRKSVIILRGDNCTISIGRNTTFGGIRIVNVGSNNAVTIGENCLFSDHIELWASDTHPIYDLENKIINKEKPVKIGDNVWVGSRVIILKGVNICRGSILGMGSVILNDVPAETVSAGYPNKVLKQNVHWKLNHE
jgi:carbonic anhydrase/acetyltransferase-like protein (isoleucine patch superfamily)